MAATLQRAAPFTAEDLEAELFDSPSDPAFSWAERQSFKECIQDPKRNKKSKAYAEFTELKKKYELILNKEDPEQDRCDAQRLRTYLTYLPPSTHAVNALAFLSQLRKHRPLHRLDRRKTIQQAQRLLPLEESAEKPSLRLIKKQLCTQLRSPVDELTPQEKVTLLRSLPKHMNHWDKIVKEFKEKPPAVDQLKQAWRKLKGTMRLEVKELRKKQPQYNYVKWIRAAARRMEVQLGKSDSGAHVIDATHAPKRADVLSLMAQVEESELAGIASTKDLPFSSGTCFKPFTRTQACSPTHHA